MFWLVNVLGQKIDVFVVEVLKVDVLELEQIRHPQKSLISQSNFYVCIG
jgi:hypothetical protein